MQVKTGIGQDSHRFSKDSTKVCKIAGVVFENHAALDGNSDADIVLHAICNALTGIHGKVVLGKMTDEMCAQGITDSAKYVELALSFLNSYQISNVSVAIECLSPKINPKLEQMKANIAHLLSINIEDVAITATTGEGLTDFGKGLGAQALVIISAQKK